MSGLWVLRPEEDGSDATEMTLEQLRGRIEELEMIVEAEPKAAPRPCPRCGPGHSMETQHVCERCGHRETTDGREPVAPAADAGGERAALRKALAGMLESYDLTVEQMRTHFHMGVLAEVIAGFFAGEVGRARALLMGRNGGEAAPEAPEDVWEFIHEVSLPPYADSDLASLLEALRRKALWLLETRAARSGEEGA